MLVKGHLFPISHLLLVYLNSTVRNVTIRKGIVCGYTFAINF